MEGGGQAHPAVVRERSPRSRRRSRRLVRRRRRSPSHVDPSHSCCRSSLLRRWSRGNGNIAGATESRICCRSASPAGGDVRTARVDPLDRRRLVRAWPCSLLARLHEKARGGSPAGADPGPRGPRALRRERRRSDRPAAHSTANERRTIELSDGPVNLCNCFTVSPPHARIRHGIVPLPFRYHSWPIQGKRSPFQLLRLLVFLCAWFIPVCAVWPSGEQLIRRIA